MLGCIWMPLDLTVELYSTPILWSFQSVISPCPFQRLNCLSSIFRNRSCLREHEVKDFDGFHKFYKRSWTGYSLSSAV